MKQILLWLVGAVILALVVTLILLYPLTFPSYSGLPHSGLLTRALNLLILAAFLCLYRVIGGPTAADRIVAIDILGILVVGLCALLTIASGQSWYLDIGIVWALQSFIGSLALAKHLEGRSFDD